MAKRAINFAKNFSHYFYDANPFRTIESLSTLIDHHIILNKEKTIALVNKPPGFILSGVFSLSLKKIATESR